jgi:hypothetical protein
MFSEQDALSVAKLAAPDTPEDWSSMVSGMMKLYNEGFSDGLTKISKAMYITGIKEGLYRASWIANGIRYVGPVASKDNTLVEAYRKVDEEFKSGN